RARRSGVPVFLRRLRRRARAAVDVLPRDRNRGVCVHGVLLRERARVGVLLGQADLEHVLLLAVAAAAGEAAGAAAVLARVRGLVGRARVRRIGCRTVVSGLRRGAGAANDVVSGNPDGDVGVDRVLLGRRIRVSVLLRLRRLDHVLLLAVAAAAGDAAGAAAGLRWIRGLVRAARVGGDRVGVVPCRLGGRAGAANHVVSGDADGDV